MEDAEERIRRICYMMIYLDRGEGIVLIARGDRTRGGNSGINLIILIASLRVTFLCDCFFYWKRFLSG